MAGGWRDVAGVRIAPAELCFRDAVPGGRYRAALSVQNRRVESCRLQLLPPHRPQVRGGREGSRGECLPPRPLARAGGCNVVEASFSLQVSCRLCVCLYSASHHSSLRE